MTGESQPDVPPPVRPSIFLSYASADRAAARALRDTLAAAGLEVWLDEDELGGGEAWDTKIRNQIRTCTYFMPLISATTEVRREGYFRREWRFAVERTLDLADDVLFLVPIVIDGTRDAGARVPEKFFSVQWLRVPNGEATRELRELAAKLALGEAVAVTPVIAPPAPVTRAATRGEKSPPPPFPAVPPFPESGQRFRFLYDLAIWAGHLIHALWMRLPRAVRVVASVIIVFNVITWIFNGRAHQDSTKADKEAVQAEVTREIAAVKPPDTPGKPGGAEVIKNLVGAAANVLQSGRPLAVVRFAGTGDNADTYAEGIFDQTFERLSQKYESKVSVSPIPLDSGDDTDDILARGTKLESQYLLVGSADRHAAGQPLIFSARLFHVKQRSVIWSENYSAAEVDAPTVAQRIADAVGPLVFPAAKP